MGTHQAPFTDGWKHRCLQARKRALAGRIKRADRFHRGADKFDPEWFFAVKRPDIEKPAAPGGLALGLDFRLKGIAGLLKALGQRFRVMFLAERDPEGMGS